MFEISFTVPLFSTNFSTLSSVSAIIVIGAADALDDTKDELDDAEGALDDTGDVIGALDDTKDELDDAEGALDDTGDVIGALDDTKDELDDATGTEDATGTGGATGLNAFSFNLCIYDTSALSLP
jgi:ABC-type transporter Mla subunit MlaD